MSYEDFSEVIYLPSVIKGGKEVYKGVETTPKSDVGLFAAPLDIIQIQHQSVETNYHGVLHQFGLME